MFVVLLWLASLRLASAHVIGYGEQPLSKIAIHKAISSLRESVSIQANPVVLGLQVQINFMVTWQNIIIENDKWSTLLFSFMGFAL